jgi:hypothetical protein
MHQGGIPMSQLPLTPAADASFKEKSRHTWELRRAWQRKTGRQIERLTPPGYYDKIVERRRLAKQARGASLTRRHLAEAIEVPVDTATTSIQAMLHEH